jgi:hypothetical protein
MEFLSLNQIQHNRNILYNEFNKSTLESHLRDQIYNILENRY